eukprot:CAMPEP_0176097624 /NCGR_PEP_ID=MMETSP0120_2-20121206/48947_1 /TAXON_ID=160619 /ORGANISM="Kryptoperidinium foliaceum, Strain CCMP 1326" /LENGTH=135 /DNA_ID=CAMNT_0017431627 /DNA_START=43 /DNA_END=451 /DNA_ORIENTATION=-
MASSPQHSGGVAIMDAMRELERLEMALVEERQRGARLEEERRALEEARERDVSMLEGMLHQALKENELLKARIDIAGSPRVDEPEVEPRRRGDLEAADCFLERTCVPAAEALPPHAIGDEEGASHSRRCVQSAQA